MKKSWIHKTDQILLASVPTLILFIVAIVMILPFGLALSSSLTPNLFLITVFFWSLYRPVLFPLSAVFFIGLFLDTLNGELLGMNALLAAVTYGVIYQQRSFLLPLSFSIIWSIFAVTMTVISLLGVVVHAIYENTAIDWGTLSMKVLLTVLLYPVFSGLYTRLDSYIGRGVE